MRLPFTKMHGLGNDFVVVDARERDWGEWSRLAPRLADRRLGIGCDQVLVVRRSSVADLRMDIHNADGSRAEMCGNGILCLALWARDHDIVRPQGLRVETLAGLVIPRVLAEGIEVDMGEPELEGRKIPVEADGAVKEHPVDIGDGSVKITCVSMGNPHAVVFVDDAASYPVAQVGPKVETHAFFPKRTNVEFVQVLGPTRLRMRVWERGSGVTLACGTGACAAAVAAHWTGRAARDVAVDLDGGTLQIRWDRDSSHVFMTGPAAAVFEGEFFLP